MKNIKMKTLLLVVCAVFVTLSGCTDYTQGWPYPEDVDSVYVEMFNSKSLRRGAEYTLTDAICKQLEVQTPYKIVSDRSRADSIIYGEIVSLGDTVLSTEVETGMPIEKETRLALVFSWKDLNTGKMYVNEKQVTASASYIREKKSSDLATYNLSQSFEYAADVAVNKAAEKVVESMRLEW
ncbi:MAG: LPS assembly lipoprotein LptE [Sedimentisphaeraceae bacterium JB056]